MTISSVSLQVTQQSLKTFQFYKRLNTTEEDPVYKHEN